MADVLRTLSKACERADMSQAAAANLDQCEAKKGARAVILDSLYQYFSESDGEGLDGFLSTLTKLVPDELRYRVPNWSDLLSLVCPTITENDYTEAERQTSTTEQDLMVDCVLFCDKAREKLEGRKASLQQFLESNALQCALLSDDRALLFNMCDIELKKWTKIRQQIFSLFNGQECPVENDMDLIGSIVDKNLARYKTRTDAAEKKLAAFTLPFLNKGAST